MNDSADTADRLVGIEEAAETMPYDDAIIAAADAAYHAVLAMGEARSLGGGGGAEFPYHPELLGQAAMLAQIAEGLSAYAANVRGVKW